jgi:hypothetical protein
MKKRLWSALLAAIVASAPATSIARADITIHFTNKTFGADTFDEFVNYSTGTVTGTLTKVAVNTTFSTSDTDLQVTDLNLYVDALPFDTEGRLRVGGTANNPSSYNAEHHYQWLAGNNPPSPTQFTDEVTLVEPLAFTGDRNIDGTILFGNGYGFTGTWSGSLTLVGLNFVPSNAAAVPEPASLTLLAAGTASLWARQRRRRRRN